MFSKRKMVRLCLTPAEMKQVRRAMTEQPSTAHQDPDFREAYYKIEQANRAARSL